METPIERIIRLMKTLAISDAEFDQRLADAIQRTKTAIEKAQRVETTAIDALMDDDQ